MKHSKLVLAYSGGLDTSYSLRKLSKEGYQVHAVSINTGGFSETEILDIVGSQEEFNEMMLPQRMALAKALGMDVTSLSTTSHNSATSSWNDPQSRDNTVYVSWSPSTDSA